MIRIEIKRIVLVFNRKATIKRTVKGRDHRKIFFFPVTIIPIKASRKANNPIPLTPPKSEMRSGTIF